MAENAQTDSNIKTIIEKAKKELVDLTGFSSPSAVGVKRKDRGWVVTIEIKEKQSIPESMDLLGTYRVATNQNGSIRDYERIELRKRGDTKEREEE